MFAYVSLVSVKKLPDYAAFDKNVDRKSPTFTAPQFEARKPLLFIDLCWCREGESNPQGTKYRRILSPLRLPVPPSRHFVGVIDFTACSLFLFFLLPNNKCETRVTKCGAFRGFAQPNLILPMKCCDSFSGLDADDPLLKGAPAQDSTTIVSESDLARQLNRSVRTPLRFAARGQARHASKSGRL